MKSIRQYFQKYSMPCYLKVYITVECIGKKIWYIIWHLYSIPNTCSGLKQKSRQINLHKYIFVQSNTWMSVVSNTAKKAMCLKAMCDKAVIKKLSYKG